MKKLKPFLPFFIIVVFLFSVLIAKAQTAADTTIHAIAQQKPEYPGGAHARMNFLASHLQYPENALRNKVSGKVYIGFVVEQDGSISHVKVLKGIGHGCDKEAMQVVAQMPKWKPGFIDGKPVRVRFTLPFAFNIPPDEEMVYTRVDVYPTFDVNTISGIKGFIQHHLHYPVAILKDSVTDTVNVYFVVKSNDSIMDVSVRKDTAQLDAYDYEAMRVVRNLPVSSPALLHNQPVSVQLYVQVVFDYRQVDPFTSKIFRTTFNGKTFSYYRPGMVVEPDKMPSFPGGIRALMQYLTDNIRYPEEAKKMHLQGRAILQFIVEADGSITHILVLRGVSPSLDAEAVRVIRNMPKWIPGTRRGKPVRVRFNLPIKFTMQ